MNQPYVKPEKITKPIQLLGAWLAGLFSINSTFLFAATHFPPGSWQSGALVIAGIANVPVFLISVFVLQTRFRPELQEDSYYSTYLSKRTNETLTIAKEDKRSLQLQSQIQELESRLSATTSSAPDQDERITELLFGINRHLSDLPTIAEKLSELGVISYSTFGGEAPPDDRIISISGHLPLQTRHAIIRLIRQLGFDKYNIFDNREEDTAEDVLIGSYGGESTQILTATPTRLD